MENQLKLSFSAYKNNNCKIKKMKALKNPITKERPMYKRPW